MAKSAIEKIEGIKEQIQQLENQQKKLISQQKDQERKARTKRLIERGAILESLIDGAETLTNEEVKAILQQSLCKIPKAEISHNVTGQPRNG